jgi:hypothetical protein
VVAQFINHGVLPIEIIVEKTQGSPPQGSAVKTYNAEWIALRR